MRDWAPPRAPQTPAADGGAAAPSAAPSEGAETPAPAPGREPEPASPALAAAEADLQAVRDAVSGTIVGQKTLISRLLIALLCDGHCLLEGVPGLAKSLSVSTLAATLHADFVRVQFTPDLLPADLTGTEIYNARTSEFETRQGPIFANIVLADEINRAPAKVQSALLEAMEERQVSIGGESFPLPQPFMVLATRNPIEQEGTYPLPEAQLDRFMMKVIIDYPPEDDEREILERRLGDPPTPPDPVITTAALLRARAVVGEVRLATAIRDYVVRLIRATRQPGRVDPDLERADPLRRLAPRLDRAGAGGARPRLPRRPRLHDARGRQGGRAGRAAPPPHPDLRGGGGRRRAGGHRGADAGRCRGSLTGCWTGSRRPTPCRARPKIPPWRRRASAARCAPSRSRPARRCASAWPATSAAPSAAAAWSSPRSAPTPPATRCA